MINQTMMYVLYAILFPASILSLYICYKKQNGSAYAFCVSILTLFVVTCLSTVTVINKITTPGLSIEPRIENIEESQTELKTIVASLSGLIANLYSTSWAKSSKDDHEIEEIEKYITSISKYLSPKSKEDLKNSLELRPSIFTGDEVPSKEVSKEGDLYFKTKKEKK